MVGIHEKLQVEIVEHNSEVFPIFVRNIGSNFKSGEDAVLVRFDSYADFLVPKDLQADEIERLDKFVDSIDNQSWILPAVYRGYISKILWFKPPWAHQFQDGKYQLQVGKCQQTGLLKIASTIPYFTSNCVYSSNEKLSNIHTVEIFISTAGLTHNLPESNAKSQTPVYDHYSGSESLDSDSRKKVKLSINEPNHKDNVPKQQFYSLDTALIEQMLETRPIFIDIDLSFFSTDDSIRKQFDENEYEILRYVYARIVQGTTDSEIQQYITTRENTLKQIHTLMEEYLTDPKIEQQIDTENHFLSALITVIRYKKLDWKAVHNYGMHLADTRPPLHVSSEEMIIYMLESASKILQLFKKEPILITISRCVGDGYCSLEQADLIQRYVEKKLRKLYKIDKTVGKSLFTQDDEDEDEEISPAGTKEDKPMAMSDDENSHSPINRTTDDTDSPTKVESSHLDKSKSPAAKKMEITPAQSITNLSMPTAPASSNKTSFSPGETTKAISPSSLSEASPTTD